MEPYYLYFASLLILNSALAYHQHQRGSTTEKTTRSNEKTLEEEEATLALPQLGPEDLADIDNHANARVSPTPSLRSFKLTYFPLYALAIASDWLQGPYIYTLYAHEKNLPEPVVAALFTTGFIAAAISATFVGGLADKYGRRRACRAFCVLYAVSCATVLSDNLAILFVGRVVGGVGTTLLFTVFEAWMVGAFAHQGLSAVDGEGALGGLFGFGITVSGVVAIAAGVVGEALVGWFGTKTAPFVAAIVCLIAAWWGIGRVWGENFGELDGRKNPDGKGWEGLKIILTDTRILTLSLASAIFEGSMYLFVFFWSPALLSARIRSAETTAGNETATPGSTPDPPPFGLIFSTFMSAMMLGSLLYTHLQTPSTPPTSHPRSPTPGLKRNDSTSSPAPHAHLLQSLLSLSSIAFLTTTLVYSEPATFFTFLLFETCVGLYFPTMSRLKNLVVGESVRAKVYAWMRLPLNILVVVALGVTREGDAHRVRVFTVVGALLLGGFLVVGRVLVR
ncbi:hypothetical protein MBLNU230_g0646t1 [Neophaeotheca triangularis]